MEPRFRKRSLFVADLFSSLSESDKNDKAFKQAMFNGLAILLVLVALGTFCGVYYILHPFIKPLLWALLVGSALHPFKVIIADKLLEQVNKLESSSNPLYVNVVILPFSFVFKLSDALGDFFLKHLTVLLKIFASLCLVAVFSFYTPNFLWNISRLFFSCNKFLLNFTLDLFKSTFTVGTIASAFFGALIFLWNPKNRPIFSYGSVFLWLATSAWLSNLFLYLRIPVFVALQILLCATYFYTSVRKPPDTENNDSQTPESKPKVQDESVGSDAGSTFNSMAYIRWLSFACSMVLLINVASFPYVLFILLSIYGVKQTCLYFKIIDWVSSNFEICSTKFSEWYKEREEILNPPLLKHGVLLFGEIRVQLLKIIKDCCDSAAAVLVILALLFFVLFISVFFTVQAYKESVYLIQAGGSIINSTVVHNPELHQMLPEDWQKTMDVALNNAYIYVRETLAKMIRGLLKGKDIDHEKGSELEKGALELWDRAYQAWVMPIQPTVGPTVTPDAVLTSCYSFLERLKKTPEVMSWDSIREFIQENMSTLSTGLDSVWSILRGNMSLLLGILSTLFSLIFGGGLSVINFTLHSVVFLSALFYLLSSSREFYKPVEMITQVSPKYGNKLALAVEQSCRDVLAASAKLSIFYGLWTWLIHTVFQSNLIYMPAVFAAVLGVVPVLGTYWACLPAVLDLWLMQDSKIRALGLFLAQIFPTAVVETTVYNEIQGSGHPYLTGLSIAGGMFWLGIEGAIAGPLILCFLFTILNMLSGLEMTKTGSP